jgi:hypothetical protein
MRRRARAIAAILISCVALLAACHKTVVVSSTDNTTVTQTETLTSPPKKPSSTPGTAIPVATAAPLSPSEQPPAGQLDADCPYLATADAQDLEGNRIYRVTVTGSSPPTCRFFFWAPDFHPVLMIAPTKAASATAAYNTMVKTGEKGTNPQSVKGLVSGVDGVLYQTQFYAQDQGQDWACTFAKGALVVTVYTDQDNVSYNALHIARVIAGRV